MKKISNYYNLPSVSCNERDIMSKGNNNKTRGEICEQLNPENIYTYLFPSNTDPLSIYTKHQNKKINSIPKSELNTTDTTKCANQCQNINNCSFSISNNKCNIYNDINTDNLINDNGFFILFELAQNMFSISGLLQLAYINKEALIKKQKAKNYNNLFSKFNLNINFKSLKAFIEGDSVNVGDSPIDLVFRYPNQSDVTSNKLFAPQTKLELAEGIGYLETYDNAPPNDEYLGLREVNRNYGDFSTSNFTRLIRDLTQYLPDKFEYLVNFVYDYTVMGIREYEKIELIEETEQEGDLTSDIDNIFAETFEDEIDDIFADTF